MVSNKFHFLVWGGRRRERVYRIAQRTHLWSVKWTGPSEISWNISESGGPCTADEMVVAPKCAAEGFQTKTRDLNAAFRKCLHWSVYLPHPLLGLCHGRIPSWLPLLERPYFQDRLQPYWSADETEYATDVMLHSAGLLAELYPSLLRLFVDHGLVVQGRKDSPLPTLRRRPPPPVLRHRQSRQHTKTRWPRRINFLRKTKSKSFAVQWENAFFKPNSAESSERVTKAVVRCRGVQENEFFAPWRQNLLKKPESGLPEA